MKISQLLSSSGLNYAAVLEKGNVTQFFQPDSPGQPDDAFYQSVLKDAYDGKTTYWEKADKSI